MKPPAHSSPPPAANDTADTGQPLLQAARDLRQPEPGPALDAAILRAAAERAAEVRKARAEVAAEAAADLPKMQKAAAASRSVKKHSLLERFSRWLLGDGETRGHLGQAVAASVFMGVALGLVLQATRENTLSPALSERDIVVAKPEGTPEPSAIATSEELRKQAAAPEREGIAGMAAQFSAHPEARAAAPSETENLSRAAIAGTPDVPPATKPVSPSAPEMRMSAQQAPSAEPFLTPHLSDSAPQRESAPSAAGVIRFEPKPEPSSAPSATPTMASSPPPPAQETGGTKEKMSSIAGAPPASPQKPRAQQRAVSAADTPSAPVASSSVPVASAPEMNAEMSEARKMSPAAASSVPPRTQEKVRSLAVTPAMPAASAPAQTQMPKREEAVSAAAPEPATAPVMAPAPQEAPPSPLAGDRKKDREANREALREVDRETDRETEIKTQLKRILELRRAGKKEEAQVLLRELRVRYPQGDIDGRLRRLEGQENR